MRHLFFLLAMVLLAAGQPGWPGFQASAPPAAMNAALKSQLKLVRNWIDEKDYASAAQGSQELGLLVQLYGHQSVDKAWTARITELRTATTGLAAAAKSKDKAKCELGLKECERLIALLASEGPKGEKPSPNDFKMFGSTKSWMMLMDGAYSDAKRSDSAKEVEQLAAVLADEAALVKYLKNDVKWSMTSDKVAALAREAQAKAKAGDLTAAKAELKKAYGQCEYCHQGFKR